MARRFRLTLPGAPPDLYLRWMGYWRDIERVMLDHPRLAALAGEEAAPFLRDPIADYLSQEVLPQIVEQARDEQGATTVAPVLTLDADKTREALHYMAKRVAWLSRDGVYAALGVQKPGDDIEDLRIRVMVAAREQLNDVPSTRGD